MTGGRRVKVLDVIARLNIGGAAQQSIILTGGLDPARFDTVLVHGSLAEDEGSLEHLVAPRVRVVKIRQLGRPVRPLSDLVALLRLVRLLFAESPDAVHTHTAKAGTLGRLAALAYNMTRSRTSRCVTVHTFHGHVFDGYFGAAGSTAARLVERALARVSDRVVTISPSQHADIVERYRIAPASRVSLVPLGLDLDRLFELGPERPALRSTLGWSDAHLVFGYVGRLVPIKDIDTLLRAFRQVVAGVPQARLLIVGDGKLRPALENLAGSLGLADTVRFIGWCRDLCSVYGSIDVAVLSSLNEGTPVSLIEAMAASRPSVATSIGGVPDVVADGETGLLVPPRDPGRLAGAMTRLAVDAGMRMRMGQAGRARANRYRAERLIRDLEEVYVQALVHKRGARAARDLLACPARDRGDG